MSKEKQCECCHEWWYDSDVKENLCPNCYDYFKQLKQQLAEKDKQINNLEQMCQICNKEQENEKLKQELAEKDKEIKRFMSMKNREQLVAENEVLKDTIAIVLAQKRNVVQHKTQLAIQELEKVKMQLKDKTKMMSNEEHCYQQKVVSWLDICNQINNQIKELKGE